MQKPASWIPFRWPDLWQDPSLLRLLDDSPINCLIAEKNFPPSVREAALKRELNIVDWARPNDSGVVVAARGNALWKTPHPVLTIEDAVWPGVKMSRKQDADAEAGPTGAPWVDSNGWSTELVQAHAPQKTVWLPSEPPSKTLLPAEAYLLAVADAAAFGARWIVTLDEPLAVALMKGDTVSLTTWRRIGETLRVFEKHSPWNSFQSEASMGVIADYSGDNEYMAGEILNLAARRNLLCRPIPLSKAATADFSGLAGLLLVDPARPEPKTLARLEAFVRQGGLLISPSTSSLTSTGMSPATSPVPEYVVKSLERGRVATPVKEWEDPWLVAAAAHNLVSRRADPIRLYNSGTTGCRLARTLDGHKSVVELLNYTTRPSSNAVTLGVRNSATSAKICTLEKPLASSLDLVKRKNGVEFPLPAFSVWAAVEMES